VFEGSKDSGAATQTARLVLSGCACRRLFCHSTVPPVRFYSPASNLGSGIDLRIAREQDDARRNNRRPACRHRRDRHERMQPGAFCTRSSRPRRRRREGEAPAVTRRGCGSARHRAVGGRAPPRQASMTSTSSISAAEVLGRLVAQADVLVESSRPAPWPASASATSSCRGQPGLVWLVTGSARPVRTATSPATTHLPRFAGVLSTLADVDEQPFNRSCSSAGGLRADARRASSPRSRLVPQWARLPGRRQHR